MQKITMRKSSILALVLAGILATTSTALAEKPSWAGGGKKGNKHEQSERQDSHENYDRQHDDRHSDDRDRDGDSGRRTYFGDQHRTVINNYYVEQYRSGHCPPGLVRSNKRLRAPRSCQKMAVRSTAAPGGHLL